jgi:type I restriction-modification system DNA methylase subunit
MMKKTKPAAPTSAPKRDLIEELRRTASLYDPACPSHSLLMRAAAEIEALRRKGK